uniref:Uncharacterized protein n=1 Tax=Euplotes harpa TaxID=151035 RepID=A0A7S3J3Y4_9SPIT|mmetsp:Transcript_15533/g.18012  ORF Transcript_15533/g.18012 Transcript_15533/m.18012 type:complete len:217 (+) Transcript_15533:1041-1691(+)
MKDSCIQNNGFRRKISINPGKEYTDQCAANTYIGPKQREKSTESNLRKTQAQFKQNLSYIKNHRKNVNSQGRIKGPQPKQDVTTVSSNMFKSRNDSSLKYVQSKRQGFNLPNSSQVTRRRRRTNPARNSLDTMDSALSLEDLPGFKKPQMYKTSGASARELPLGFKSSGRIRVENKYMQNSFYTHNTLKTVFKMKNKRISIATDEIRDMKCSQSFF